MTSLDRRSSLCATLLRRFTAPAVVIVCLHLSSLPASLQAQPKARQRYTMLRSPERTAHGKPGAAIGERFARVYDTRFTNVGDGLGLWKGLILGEGLIHLRLVIKRDGEVLATKYIGSVHMRADEKPTPFFFRTTLPQNGNWSWNIVAKSV
jgi:hypothetical protein